MAQVDTSIYRAQVQPDFTAPLQGIALGQQIGQNAQRNRLTEMALQRQQGLDAAYSGAVDASGNLNRNQLVGALASNNLGSAIPEVQQSFAQQDRSSAQAQTAKLEQAAQQIGLVGQVLNGVNDEPSYQRARQTAQQYGLPLDGVPERFDPAWVNQTRNMATSAQQQLENEYRKRGLDLQTVRMEKDLGSYGAPIQTSQGFYQANARGEARPVMSSDGKVLTPISADVGLKRDISQASTEGQGAGERSNTAATRGVDASSMITLLDETDKLLNDATGSRLGNVADEIAGTFGVSLPGARATASLRTLAGQLISKMPRMQGPQSDRDVALYTQMAGDLANPNIPIATRRAALGTIRDLNSKYATPNGSGSQSMPANQNQAVGSPSARSISAPAAAVEYLRSNPAVRAQFDAKYGAGAAASVLGQ